MKKLNKTILLLSALLCGCNVSSTTDETITIDKTTSETINSSSTTDSSSNDSSSGTTTISEEETHYEVLTIKEVNKLCDELEGDEVNALGDKKVSITGRMMFAETINCTQKGYRDDNAFKLFVYDKTGYIYVGVNQDRYTNVFSKYEYSEDSYYTFNGTINKYLNQNEIIMESYEWLSNYNGDSVGLNEIKSFAGEAKTMEEIYTLDASLSLNKKGIAYSNVVAFDGKYIDKVENSIALFANGEYVMRVHGNNKLNNQFSSITNEETLNSSKSYRIYGVLTVYNYLPEVEFLMKEELEEKIDYTLNDKNLKTAESVWSVVPNKDKLLTNHYEEYEKLSQKIMCFEGYIATSLIASKVYNLLSDKELSSIINSNANEKANKVLRINNEGETGLTTEKDLSYSNFYTLHEENPSQKIKVYFVIHGYNTNGYYQIQIINRYSITNI